MFVKPRSNSKGVAMKDKVVLVTGGTGSFGRHFVTYLLEKVKPKKIIVYSRDEFKQFEMAQQVQSDRLRFFIGNVRDRDRLFRAFSGVDIVVHAAAMKHVPIAEYNPFEAVQTNVHGAQNVIDAALNTGVKKVLALSTDKACNPINLYGATKLCSDKLFIAANSYVGKRGTSFAVVRYGNVLGSRGSIVPLFRKLAETKGEIPITDERMTRFWITLPQAARFVHTFIDMMKGGELFFPKIPSMKIVDLARAISPKAKLKTVGIRPGEKLHELLISADDSRNVFETSDFFIKFPDFPFWQIKKPKGSKPVAPGFEYASNTNSQWLSTSDMAKLLKQEGMLP
jgi:UDP-N-acetylglucosamine 4,6-dehydratase